MNNKIDLTRLHFGKLEERKEAFAKKEKEGWCIPLFRSDGYNVDFTLQWKGYRNLTEEQLEKDLQKRAEGMPVTRKDRLKFKKENEENPTRGMHAIDAIKNLNDYSTIGIDPGIDTVLCWSKGDGSKPR